MQNDDAILSITLLLEQMLLMFFLLHVVLIQVWDSRRDQNLTGKHKSIKHTLLEPTNQGRTSVG